MEDTEVRQLAHDIANESDDLADATKTGDQVDVTRYLSSIEDLCAKLRKQLAEGGDGYIMLRGATLKCPKCGDIDNLVEQQSVLCEQAVLQKDGDLEYDRTECFWETVGPIYGEPEFKCNACDTEFYWEGGTPGIHNRHDRDHILGELFILLQVHQEDTAKAVRLITELCERERIPPPPVKVFETTGRWSSGKSNVANSPRQCTCQGFYQPVSCPVHGGTGKTTA